MHELIGAVVKINKTGEIGKIVSVDETLIGVDCGDRYAEFPFPQALSNTLTLKDKQFRGKYRDEAANFSFESFKKLYIDAIKEEIRYIQTTGGKRLRAIDGELIKTSNGSFTYLFDTDSELHLPDDTQIKIYLTDRTLYATVLSCEEFTIMIRTNENLPADLNLIEFSADQWRLLEALIERISDLDQLTNHIAYEVACNGRSKIDIMGKVTLGQPKACEKVKDQPVTFIWGPPGTGKTRTLATIALSYMGEGKRVLMLSYSNVSVDGAVLRLVQLSDRFFYDGKIVRYGYPRMQEIIENKSLTSYQIVLERMPDLAEEFDDLLVEKRKLKQKDPKRIEINRRLTQIRTKIKDAERELVHQASFVATTVSKALVDSAIYGQQFDLVIFDEASMAYVPQIVFAAGLAKERFCCLGDFRQLPAIVQNSTDSILLRDIFEYTGIVEAVDHEFGHEWLVMLYYQYRMHPYIAEFVSERMYDKLLKSDNGIFADRQRTAELAPLKGEAMGLIDISGTYSVCIKTMDGSRINILSALLAVYTASGYAKEIETDPGSIIAEKRISDRIGIITPYNAQSRLIVAMLRDLQEKNRKYKQIACATVHQFQGSEKSIIIYDAVDCYRMTYPGMLLTSKKNDTANRLFNVALTRTQGKFLMIANRDYLKRKKIAKDLIFTQFMDQMCKDNKCVYRMELISSLQRSNSDDQLYLGDRDTDTTWKKYIDDIHNAQSEIHIDVPGQIHDDDKKNAELTKSLQEANDIDVRVKIRYDEETFIPKEWEPFAEERPYITMPVTIIDGEIVWFGQPLAAPDFMSEGNILETKYFPCIRFAGIHTARSIKAFLEI